MTSIRILLCTLLFLAPAAPAALAASAPPGYARLDGARHGQYLRMGSHGPAVLALQVALDAAGFAAPQTGVFGAATRTAVEDLQRQAGIGVDGVIGPHTMSALDRALGLTGGGGSSGGGTTASGIPARPAGAITGSDFISQTWSLSRPDREAAILQEISAGNIPDFERTFHDVTVAWTDARLRPHVATFHVAPDYLAIGSNADFVRMPMNPLTAQKICDQFGCSLPTRKMVNAIWSAATVKLAPIPQTPGPQMMSNAYIDSHERKIEAEMAAQGAAPGPLTAGDKKDVVISNRLIVHPDRVAIYGWHLLTGQPIQQLTTVHENTYADYSHGVRLVLATVSVDGRDRAIADVLRDPAIAPILSDEGVMPSPRVPGVP